MKIKDRGVTREVSEKDYKRKYKGLGYKIVEENKLSDLTVSDLRDMAKEMDIEGYYDMRKAELIDALGGD